MKWILKKLDIAAVTLYLVVGVAFIPQFRYEISTDGTSYVSIAQKYYRGDFWNAINGCWAPLYSWLLALTLPFVNDKLLATKVLGLLIGLFTLVVFRHATTVVRMKNWIRNTLCFAVIPTILYYADIQITSDLLLCGLILLYITLVVDGRYLETGRRATLTGVVAALCYLAKYYAFPLILIHLPAASLAHLFFKRSRNGARNFSIAMITFLCVSMVWIATLSLRYGHFTTNTVGAYDMALAGPTRPLFLMDEGRLIPPPNPTARSMWEDPTLAAAPLSWSPFDSWNSFLYEIRLCLKNLWLVVRYIHDFTVFASAIIVGYMTMTIRRRRPVFIQPLLALLIYPAGYVLIRVEPRYLYPLYLLLLLMAGHLLSILPRRRLAVAVVVLSFITLPALHLWRARGAGADVYTTAQMLRDAGVQGRIASNTNWNGTLYLAEYLDWSYYGYANVQDIKELDRQLKQYQVDYYCAWMDVTPDLQRYLENFQLVTTVQDPPFRVYKLR